MNPFLPALRIGLPLALGVLAAGCRVGPDHQVPRSALPGAYAPSPASISPGDGSIPLASWWRIFEDPTLQKLMEGAVASNLDLRIAQVRVREARAQSGITRSSWFPQLQAVGTQARTRISGHSLNGEQLKTAGRSLENESLGAGFDLAWEIDLFGGTRRAAEADGAETQAAQEAGHGTKVTLLSDVGVAYLDLRAAQRRLQVARTNLAVQEITLTLIQDRVQAGLASDFDAARAEALVAATRSLLPPQEEAIHRAIHRLSVLCARHPKELEPLLMSPANQPAGFPRVPVGLPSDLLRQRPDLRRAERQLAAATARIGIAVADLFPRFYLTGAAGLDSVQASDFASAGSRFWSLGPTVRWPIFTAGRIRQNIRVQETRQEQAAIQYEQAVLISLEEVENALLAFGQEQERHGALTESERSCQRAMDLASGRYRGGLADFMEVLDAHRSLLAVQDQVTESRRRLGHSLVLLYKALGGGWETPGDHRTLKAQPSPESPSGRSEPGIPRSS